MITHQKINDYREYCPGKCDNCKNVMLKARQIAREISESCRKSMEITCNGDHFTLRFLCGLRGNQILVSSNNGKVDVTLRKQTWREWFTPGGIRNTIKTIQQVTFSIILVFVMARNCGYVRLRVREIFGIKWRQIPYVFLWENLIIHNIYFDM
jgi:hypothetical protein